jgi:ankyrin repeat protein
MKHLLLTTIAAVLVVGCGQSQQSAPPAEAKPKPPTAKAPDISIHDAAREGNIEAVKQHIAAGTDVNEKDGNGWSPLHYATHYAYEAGNNHEDIAKMLIAKGADVNLQRSSGMAPLHNAANHGLNEVVKLLIEKGANVNSKAELGCTPLMIATNTVIAELLIKNGANVNATYQYGTGLHIAAGVGNRSVAEWFIANGLDVNTKDGRGNTPLDSAISRKQTETADLLRKHGGKTGEELEAEGK